MSRCRKPLSPTAWFLGALAGALIYQVRIIAIENMAENQIARAQAVTQQIQQQARQQQLTQTTTASPSKLLSAISNGMDSSSPQHLECKTEDANHSQQ